jgi:hypothetical protein
MAESGCLGSAAFQNLSTNTHGGSTGSAEDTTFTSSGDTTRVTVNGDDVTTNEILEITSDTLVDGTSLLVDSTSDNLTTGQLELILKKNRIAIPKDFQTSFVKENLIKPISKIKTGFNEFKEDKWDSYELSEIAFQAERLDLEIAGGWQDQYACTFGGINFIEFKHDDNIISPLRLAEKTILELEANLVLCDTGIKHDSGAIHKDQKSSLNKNADIEKLVELNVQNTYDIKNMLLKGRLNSFGELLGNAWDYKKQFSSKISSPEIDRLYSSALNHGASGGKLLGAGGGGFFLFYATGVNKSKLVQFLEQKSLRVYPIKFDSQGMQSWKVRTETALSKK